MTTMNSLSCRPQRGFTLIETAVSLLVLATGLLGMAYLQTRAMQYGIESQNRTVINLMVADMADRMRTHRIPATATAATDYTGPLTSAELKQTCTPDGTTVTTPRQDAICFYKAIAERVPGSMMAIDTIDLDGDGNTETYRIQVYWSDHQLSQGGLGSSNADGSVNESDCKGINGVNRIWSGDLIWPGSQTGLKNVCLVSHTWRFQVPGS